MASASNYTSIVPTVAPGTRANERRKEGAYVGVPTQGIS